MVVFFLNKAVFAVVRAARYAGIGYQGEYGGDGVSIDDSLNIRAWPLLFLLFEPGPFYCICNVYTIPKENRKE